MWSRTHQVIAAAVVAVGAWGVLAGDAHAQLRRYPARTVAPAAVPRQPGRVWIAPSSSGYSSSYSYVSPYLWGPYDSYPGWYTNPYDYGSLSFYNYGSFYRTPTYYNPYINGYANPYLNRYRNVYNVYLVNPYGAYGGYYP